MDREAYKSVRRNVSYAQAPITIFPFHRSVTSHVVDHVHRWACVQAQTHSLAFHCIPQGSTTIPLRRTTGCCEFCRPGTYVHTWIPQAIVTSTDHASWSRTHLYWSPLNTKQACMCTAWLYTYIILYSKYLCCCIYCTLQELHLVLVHW